MAFFFNKISQIFDSFQTNKQKTEILFVIDRNLLKIIYSEKATLFCEISTVDLSYIVTVKSTVAFSEYMTFTSKNQFLLLHAQKGLMIKNKLFRF